MRAELTLYDYWRIINRRKWTALMLFCLVMSSTFFYTLLRPAVYKSQAIIKFQPPASYNKIPGSDIGDWDPRTAVATEIRILTSPEIAERAGRKLGWLNRNKDSAADAEGIDELLAAYTAERLQDSNLISISAVDPAPLVASGIVEAVIEAYRDYDLEQKSKQGRKNLEDIASRRTEVEENLRSLERARQNFMEKNPKTGLGAALANQLADMEIRKKQLLEKYTSDHPDLMGLEQRIQTVQAKLGEIPSQEIELARISRELRMQEELYTVLNKQYEEAKLGLSSVVSFVSVVRPARASAAPVSPDKPLNLMIGAALGLFLALAGVFLFENLDISINTIEDIEAFLKLPVLGFICHVPDEKRMDNWLAAVFRKERTNVASYRSALISGRRHASGMIESFHSLRINIIAQLKSNGSVSLVFSSAGAAEGKTLTAVNFALAAAHAGLKTLLVDADIRRSTIYRIFGLDKQPGLSDILADKLDWRTALCESADFAVSGGSFKSIGYFTGIDKLKIINSGTTRGDIVDFMDSGGWAELMGNFKSEFDIIVFDTPPALLFVDAVILARHADGVVMVYRAGRTARDALKRATEQIMAANARVLGVALNGVRVSEMGPQYGYYYYDYKKYAGR